MSGNNAMHNRKSDTGAGKLLAAVQTLKHTKQLVRVAHVESRAVVLHLVDGFTVFDASADGDLWGGALRAVFERVTDQVAPDLTDHHRGGPHGRQVSAADL